MIAAIVAMSLLIFATDSTGEPAAPDSVTVPTEMLRRSVAVIDSLDLEIELRNIRLAHADSVQAIHEEYWQREIRIYQESYERVIKAFERQEDPWYAKILKDHRVWLLIGLFLGLQADRGI